MNMTNKKKSSSVYHVGGLAVEFPYQPYGSQMAFMGRVISTLDRAVKEGHCHALLESPTGTGKSLSLLCSALAWQNSSTRLVPSPAAFLPHAGGFLPPSQPPSSSASGNPEQVPPPITKGSKKKKSVPTIFYASRTHSQISQVIREYKKTSYRVPMAVLASRKHYCTNEYICGRNNVDEECKLLMKDPKDGCPEFKNVHKLKGHHSLKTGGCYEVHDIEDLVKVGRQLKGCSYFAARSMAEDAQLVFCPYSYIVNPIIRRAMEVDITKAIIILDEAHNIEDMAREAGSVDAEEDVLHKLQMELGQLALGSPTIYQPLHEMILDVIDWMERRKFTLEKREFQHYCSCWTGDKALKELQEANISQQCFPILQDCATKAIQAASDAESEIAHLSPTSVVILEGLFSSLSYFFSGNGTHINDYQLAIRRYIKRDAGVAAPGWTHTLSLWCLNPAVVFRDISDVSLSVILTSGTLSPMNSFSSELGVQFGTCLEAPHVINVDSQVWTAVVSSGPGNYPLNASYKTADAYAYQDALGKSLEEISKVVPGGSLIFFPSYKLMEKLCTRWRETGQWSRLNAQKPLFVEPRGGNPDEFEAVLTGYYDSIHGKKKPAPGTKRKGKKLGLKNCDIMECAKNSNEGAALLAVCRGKVSEGIDFSDEKARVVIIVGIPFPNINDLQVAQKKKYNDTYKSSRNLLSGSQWYCHQAFRALNQAAGRCIRHRFDYGAIIFLDERFCEERNIMYVSKWLRKSIRQYDSFDKSLKELESFFSEVKKTLGKEALNISQKSDDNVGKKSVMGQNKGITRNEFLQEDNSCDVGRKSVADSMMEVGKFSTLSPSSISQETSDATFTRSAGNVEVQELFPTYGKYHHSPTEYTDLDCISQEDSRCSEALSGKSSYDDPDLTVVQETPDIDASHNIRRPGAFCKDENSISTVEFQNQCMPHTASPRNSVAGPPKSNYSSITPVKNAAVGTNCSVAEQESALNLSVNSHTQKRRKSVGSTIIDLTKTEQFDSPSPSTPAHISHMSSLAIPNDVKKVKLSCDPNSDLVNGERMQICCSLCKKPLGIPENHFFVMSSTASSSKVYLKTLLRGSCEVPAKGTSSIPVLICDTSSVDHRLYKITHESGPGQGIWSKEDGCVFNTIFCPFCANPGNCLGVQIMATDASNVQLLNKVLLYRDLVEVINPEASIEKGLAPVCLSQERTYATPILIEDFAYVPQHQKLDGWRTTRSKMQLPKRGTSSRLR